MQLGPVKFQVAPFNITEYDHDHSGDWVEKPVLGVMPPLEFVGAAIERWNLQAKLFPVRFGGLPDLDQLQAARSSGLPQYLMRGDGVPLGWVAIEKVTEKNTYLDRHAIGAIIAVDIALKRASKPAAGLFYSIISGLLR
jgi:phage protein U